MSDVVERNEAVLVLREVRCDVYDHAWQDGGEAAVALQICIDRLSKLDPSTRYTELERTIKTLAEGLLEIAEIAMPGSYFESDLRCQTARAALANLAEGSEPKC